MRAPSKRVALSLAIALTAPAFAWGDEPVPVPAAALPSLSPPQIGNLMHAYYEGEKLTVIPFALAGVAGIASGSLLVTGPGELAHGAGWPILAFGAVELLAGALFSIQAISNRKAMDKLLAEDPREFARRERHHVYRIRDLFQPILLAVEGVVAAAGGAMAGAGALRNDATLEGVGLGLLVEGVLLFALDWTVLDRARPYAAGLAQFEP